MNEMCGRQSAWTVIRRNEDFGFGNPFEEGIGTRSFKYTVVTGYSPYFVLKKKRSWPKSYSFPTGPWEVTPPDTVFETVRPNLGRFVLVIDVSG